MIMIVSWDVTGIEHGVS